MKKNSWFVDSVFMKTCHRVFLKVEVEILKMLPFDWTDFKMSTSWLVIWFVCLRICSTFNLKINAPSKIIWTHCEPSIYRVLFVMCDFLELLFNLAIFKWQLDKNHHVAKSVWKRITVCSLANTFEITNIWKILKTSEYFIIFDKGGLF